MTEGKKIAHLEKHLILTGHVILFLPLWIFPPVIITL